MFTGKVTYYNWNQKNTAMFNWSPCMNGIISPFLFNFCSLSLSNSILFYFLYIFMYTKASNIDKVCILYLWRQTYIWREVWHPNKKKLGFFYHTKKNLFWSESWQMGVAGRRKQRQCRKKNWLILTSSFSYLSFHLLF